MGEINELIKLVEDKIGLPAALILVVCGLSLLVWYQHHRSKLLQERIELEGERRRALEEQLKTKQEAPKPASPPSASSTTSEVRRPRVLVVDDDVSVVGALKLKLAHAIPYVEFRSGADGIEALQRLDEFSPDVMVLDIMMPRLDGWGVLEELRRRNSGQRVVVFTARDDDEALRKAQSFERPLVTKTDPWSILVSTVQAELAKSLDERNAATSPFAEHIRS